MELESLDLEIRAGEGVGTIESSVGMELTVYEGDANQEPYVGMIFKSEDAAKAYYDEYAKRIGFIGRIVGSHRSERDGSFISRKLACNKEGFNVSRTKLDKNRKRRVSQREGCMAMMLVKKQKPGKWTVTKFVKEHNHMLGLETTTKEVPTPDEKDKKIHELSSELNRTKRQLTACREQLSVFMKLIEEHAQHLSGTVGEIVDDMKKIES